MAQLNRSAQLSYSDNVGWFYPSFSRNSQFTGFWGSGGLTEISRPPRAQNGPKTPKSGFSWSWGPLWVKRPLTKFVCVLNVDPVNPVWGPTCPWDLRWPSRGELGAVSAVGDRFYWLGSQLTKNRFGRNSAPPASFREFFGSSKPRSCCATFLLC